jgi:acyl-CoA synthetase (AMP-forming)/AMP-acid ligase II
VLSSEDVLAFCRERLANYKVPRRVEFRGELPRNPSGKVLKRVLKEEP